MKRVLITIILVFLSLPFWGRDYGVSKERSMADSNVSSVCLSEYQKDKPQECNYLTIKEYEIKDYINIRNVHLPEYELRDSSMADLISRFIEAEKHQQHYDKDGYILLCKETPAIWTLMSIFPNMYSFSYYGYGSYDGVLYLDNHTFIVSFGKHDPYPFIPTENNRYLEFLEFNQPIIGMKGGKCYYYTMPDPYEDDYPIWWVRYDKDHYELMEKPGVIYRIPSSEILPRIDFDLNPKAESDVLIKVL